MKDEQIDQILEALVDDYTWQELNDKEFMLCQMNTLLGIAKPQAETLLLGAREIKKVRSFSVPLWKQLLMMH